MKSSRTSWCPTRPAVLKLRRRGITRGVAAVPRVLLMTGAILVCVLEQPVHGQGTTCRDALSQLQGYVAQVNTVANGEYYRGIPFRCQGNPLCMHAGLGQLNQWYMYQSGLVNNWYGQIARQCTTDSTPPRVRSRPQTEEEPGRIDTEAMDDLELDDKDKSVRIKIPDNPKGFKD